MSAESRIQTAAIRYAIAAGFMVKRNAMMRGAATGWPDVEFLVPGGRVFFIEFKAPGKKASPRQRHIIKKLGEIGHMAFVCDNLESAKEIIDAHC